MARARMKTNARGVGNGHAARRGMPFTAQEYQLPLVTLLSELTEMWYSAAKRLTTYAIDTAESLTKGTIEVRRGASSWAKDTPFAPLLEEQQDITREFVERSADVARRLYLLQLERSEEATERVEGELLHLARPQA